MKLSQHEEVMRFAEKMTHPQLLLMLEAIQCRVAAHTAVNVLSYTATAKRWELICEAFENEKRSRQESK